MKTLKQLFCFHVWEWELDYNHDAIKICRKCGKVEK